jgi:hypothetical protein
VAFRCMQALLRHRERLFLRGDRAGLPGRLLHRSQVLRGAAGCGKRILSLEPIHIQNDHFTETGLGQTQGKHSKRDAFPAGFSTALHKCCGDSGVCCLTCWCPCFTWGRIAEYAIDLPFWGGCLTYCCCSNLACCE